MKELIQIQSELKAPKNQRNNFGKYNYRSCEDILEAVKPLLKIYNCTLTISDQIKEVAGNVYVESTAIFSCGDLQEVVTAQAGIDFNRKGMDISQSFGSSSSYARKYALNGLFLIDDTKDADTKENTSEAKLKECKTLKDLQTVYTSLSKDEQKRTVKLKDELKNKLK